MPDLVVYRPDNALRRGHLSLVAEIAAELVRTRWLTYQLFKRDLFSFYKQSFVGAFWIIILPLITVGTFIVLKGSGVVAVGDLETPYPIFAILGIAFWQLFAQGIVGGAHSLVLGGEMISRINFSKKALVLASMGKNVLSFAILVVVVVVLFVVYRYYGYHYAPQWTVLLLPVVLLPLVLFTLGLSFIFALLNAIMRDIGTVLTMVVPFVMLLTPVLYDKPQAAPDADVAGSVLARLTDYNPLYYLVAAPRDLVLRGHITELSGFAVTAAISVVLFVVSIFAFHLTETRIAERI